MYQKQIQELKQEIKESRFEAKVKEKDHETELQYYKDLINEQRDQKR